jgi:hypothetical protein
MMKGKISLAALAMIGAAAGMGAAVGTGERAGQAAQEIRAAANEAAKQPAERTRSVTSTLDVARWFGLGRNAPSHLRVHPKTGWSNRRYQRAATKRRNQARHRAACKGA